MREIPLTQGFVALVDDEDFDHLDQWKWQVSKKPGTKIAYAKNSWGRSMHREIMRKELAETSIPKAQIDHINGNGIDNRKENLRVVTQSVNLHNRPIVGVNWNKSGYQARIQIDGKRVTLGVFDTWEEAVEARKKAAEEHFGSKPSTK